LGTPSALVLTNATGTPAAINLTNATALPKAALPTGSILQVVNGQSSTTITGNSLSYTSIGLSVSITPISASSKLFIMVSFNAYCQSNQAYDEAYAAFDIYNGSSSVAESGLTSRWGNSSQAGRIQADMNMQAFVNSSSTSSRTYTVRGKVQNASDYFYIAMPDYVYAPGAITINNTGNITIFEIAA
jgi:hypothetical protein